LHDPPDTGVSFRLGTDRRGGPRRSRNRLDVMTFASRTPREKADQVRAFHRAQGSENIQILVSIAFGQLRRLRRAPCAELIALERMTAGMAQPRGLEQPPAP
jgi:hypothetical protein